MKRYQHPQNFESYLRETTDGLRMYPNDRVWRNINKQIKPSTRWPSLYISALVICLMVLTSILFVKPDENLFSQERGAANAAVLTATQKITTSPNVPFVDLDNFNRTPVAHPDLLVKNTVSDVIGKPDGEQETVQHLQRISQTSEALQTIAAAGPAIAIELRDVAPVPVAEELIQKFRPRLHLNENPAFTAQQKDLATSDNLTRLPQPGLQTVDQLANARITMDLSKPANRWKTYFYFAPTISYRMLKEEPVMQPGNSMILNPRNLDIKRLVNHRPAVGVEIGTSFARNITRNVLFNTGLVLGYRNYVISAFKSPSSSLTDLTLNHGNRIDTLSVYTELNNFNGSQPRSLNSSAFQIGIPIGLMVQLGEVGNTSVLLSANLQPTANLSKAGWMISTDHSHYVNMPDMMRKFNVNSGIGIYFQVNPKNSTYSWQFGPQLRYQTLSSAISAYPVREHPIDYGFRIALGQQAKN